MMQVVFIMVVKIVYIYIVIKFSVVLSLCTQGYFILPGQQNCEKWLDCNDISQIKLKNPIGYGAVKKVYLAKWRNHDVAYIILHNKQYKNDFDYGLKMLKSLNPNPLIIQLIGYCKEKNIIITEYHPLNNAVHVKYLLELNNRNFVENRLNLCLRYAQILEFLHNSPIGIRVNCDSNDLFKLLSQLLINSSFDLILNDLDALPEVKKNSNITCGDRPIYSDFVAPEQRWRGSGDHSFTHGYNEKTDIWKAANVCNYFIQGPDSEIVQYHVFDIHKKCKSTNPNERPSASVLVKEYINIIKDMHTHSEL